mgnify:CR=1 FL=1
MLKIYNTYIHIPFCERKCNYCDFTSLKGSDSQIERYVNYLLKEIEIYEQYLTNILVKQHKLLLTNGKDINL